MKNRSRRYAPLLPVYSSCFLLFSLILSSLPPSLLLPLLFPYPRNRGSSERGNMHTCKWISRDCGTKLARYPLLSFSLSSSLLFSSLLPLLPPSPHLRLSQTSFLSQLACELDIAIPLIQYVISFLLILFLFFNYILFLQFTNVLFFFSSLLLFFSFHIAFTKR